MSDNGWEKEFYPIDASEVTLENALSHTIRKWEGLTRENLFKHGLKLPPIIIDGHTCALCVYYLQKSKDEPACVSCPLYLARGNVRCDHRKDDEIVSPFAAYASVRDPLPMLAWLHRCKRQEAG